MKIAPGDARFIKGILIVSFQLTGAGYKTSDGGLLKGFSLDGKNDTEAVIDIGPVIINTSSLPEYIYCI